MWYNLFLLTRHCIVFSYLHLVAIYFATTQTVWCYFLVYMCFCVLYCICTGICNYILSPARCIREYRAIHRVVGTRTEDPPHQVASLGVIATWGTPHTKKKNSVEFHLKLHTRRLSLMAKDTWGPPKLIPVFLGLVWILREEDCSKQQEKSKLYQATCSQHKEIPCKGDLPGKAPCPHVGKRQGSLLHICLVMSLNAKDTADADTRHFLGNQHGSCHV